MRKNFLLGILLIILSASSSWGALMSGSLATAGNGSDGDMRAINAFAGYPFTWSVDKDADGNWIYTYSFTPSGTNRGVAFINIEMGGSFSDLTYEFSYLKDPTIEPGLNATAPASTLQVRSIDVRPNPAVTSQRLALDPPAQQYETWSSADRFATAIPVTTVMNGIQWALPSWPYTDDSSVSWARMAATDPGMYHGFNSGWTLILKSAASPMWGRFYLDGGDWTSNNGWLMARNSEYNASVRPEFTMGVYNSGWIPVPGNAPPGVIAATPADGATNVSVNSPITATFSEAMDAGSIDGNSFFVEGVAGTVTYIETTRTATFTPDEPLANSATYKVIITGNVRSGDGDFVRTPTTWTFTTAAPTYYSGSVSNFGILDQASYDAATLQGVSNAWATVSTTTQPRGVTISWDIEKVGELWQYRYTMYGNVKASDKWVNNINIGTPLGFDTEDLAPGWTLTRQEAKSTLVPTPLTDIETVDIVSSTTGPGAASPLTAPGGSGSIFGIQWHLEAPAIFVKDQASEMFVLTFSTARAPVWGDILIESGATSGGGTATPIVFNSKFGLVTTDPVADGNNGGWVLVPGNVDVAPPPTDDTPPTVFGTAPTLGATGVAVNSAVSVTFSEGMAAASINNGTFSVNGVSGTVSYDETTNIAVFTPTGPLSYSTTYTATISTAVTDLAGNAMAEDYSWNFTTAAAPDTTPPAVLSVTPADGATGVALDSAVSVTFSEAIDLSTLNGNTFGISGVSGKISYSSATITATFTPDAPLAANTAYTATAVGIKDLAGNPLAEAKSWTFTTRYVTSTGDMNGNDVVDIGDAVLALRITVGLVVATDEQWAAGDVAPLKNGTPSPDGKIDVSDAVVILRKIVGLASW